MPALLYDSNNEYNKSITDPTVNESTSYFVARERTNYFAEEIRPAGIVV
jgi:hypothetical protein